MDYLCGNCDEPIVESECEIVLGEYICPHCGVTTGLLVYPEW